jgi:5-methylcytosine-specific restriction endonuclease McrA
MNVSEPHGLKVSFFKQQRDMGLLDLSPKYQRNVVWPDSSQAYLIDTMLQGLPIPPVFMETRTSPEGITKYAIIDGKQRLESIFRFLDGNLTLPPKMSPTEAPATFQDLPEQMRTGLYSYQISAIELEGATSQAIRDMFNRLNRNVAKLTAQELRHAIYFDKPIYGLLDRLARNRFWDDVSFFSRATANRMGDIEYISQLLFALLQGAPLPGERAAIDDQYRNFDQQQYDARGLERRFNRVLKLIAEVVPDLQSTRFKQAADFYGLFVALVELEPEYAFVDKQRAGQALLSFVGKVDRIVHGEPTSDQDVTRYHSSVVEGANKFGKRRARVDLLERVAIPELRQKDQRRSFTEVERRIIWSSDDEHLCHICGRTVRQFDAYEPDHVEPHAVGGGTKIANARIAHRECNRQRGARPLATVQ